MVEWLAGNRIRGTSTERTTTTGIGNEAGGWKELGRTTLGSDNATIDVTSLADKRYLMVLTEGKTSSTNADFALRFNADTGSNYASRQKWDGGGSDYVLTSQTHYRPLGTSLDQPFSSIDYVVNKSNKEKLVIGHALQIKATGASDVMTREEHVAKWANTSSVISQVNAFTANTGVYRSGSEIVVLGWDPADTHTTNFWEELASVDLGVAGDNLSSGTFTAKKYLWVQAYIQGTGTVNANVTFNNDTTSVYAQRHSHNGAADVTSVLRDNINISEAANVATSIFVNYFIINNSANEKLVTGHTVHQSTAGAGTAPLRDEVVAKWANTSAQITEIDFTNSIGSVDFTTASKVRVWGSD